MFRSAVLALLLVVACGGGSASSKPPPDPATISGPGTAGVLACKSLLRAMDATAACGRTPDERKLAAVSMKPMREAYITTEPLPPGTLPLHTAGCVAMLDDMIEALRWQTCAFEPTADERAWVAAQRKQRTGIPPGADARTREALTWLMKVRDDLCRCKDTACVEAAQQRMNAEMKPLPDGATVAARDAGGLMIDEAMRCGRRLEHAQARKEPYQPPSPDEIARMLLVMEEAAAAPPMPDVMDDGDVEEHEEEEEEDEQPGSDVIVPFK